MPCVNDFTLPKNAIVFVFVLVATLQLIAACQGRPESTRLPEGRSASLRKARSGGCSSANEHSLEMRESRVPACPAERLVYERTRPDSSNAAYTLDVFRGASHKIHAQECRGLSALQRRCRLIPFGGWSAAPPGLFQRHDG